MKALKHKAQKTGEARQGDVYVAWVGGSHPFIYMVRGREVSQEVAARELT